MEEGFGSSNRQLKKIGMLAVVILTLVVVGCSTTAMETHKKGMESLTEKEYFIPKKPVDRHFIGCAWSKQFGPLEDPAASDIRIKVERSFDAIQQRFAYNLGASLGGQSIKGIRVKESQSKKGVNVKVGTEKGKAQKSKSAEAGIERGKVQQSENVEAGIEGGKAQQSELENVQIISPVSLADVPFEPNIPYITEALRLGDFKLKSETAGKAAVTADLGPVRGSVKGVVESGGGTSGEGLVVAYKLHMIDPKTYAKLDSGSIPLELDKTLDFPKANMSVKSQLRVIEAGANKPLPRNLLWSCDQANAKSRDMVAAWILELHSRDPKRKSLQIAFPAFPKMEDCQSFSGVIYSRIDPLTDKIIRQKINIHILQEELSDSLKPINWEARVSLEDESFNIKLIKQDDLEK